jgi:S1-C subfamily serine protease
MKYGLFFFPGLLLFSTIAVADDSVSMVRATELSAAFRQAADKVVPATVKIISRIQTTEDRRAMEIQIPALKTPPGRRNPGDSTGTGVLISPTGIVVTNNHVVGNAREVEVELPDGRNYFAEDFRSDPATDLAVIWLKLPPQETLPYASFGNSDQLDVGDWVLAMGNPFDMETTVSAGAVITPGSAFFAAASTHLYPSVSAEETALGS